MTNGERRDGALTPEDYLWAHQLLEKVTPLRRDCGVLCERICCRGLEEKAGMYLFPGEESLFPGGEDWYELEWHPVAEREFCPDWNGKLEQVGFLICNGTCPRDRRPLACRLFPLAADVAEVAEVAEGTAGGTVDVSLDSDAAVMCPLVRHATIDQLDPKFIAACRDVYRRLARDSLILADLRWQSRRRRESLSEPWRGLLQ